MELENKIQNDIIFSLKDFDNIVNNDLKDYYQNMFYDEKVYYRDTIVNGLNKIKKEIKILRSVVKK